MLYLSIEKKTLHFHNGVKKSVVVVVAMTFLEFHRVEGSWKDKNPVAFRVPKIDCDEWCGSYMIYSVFSVLFKIFQKFISLEKYLLLTKITMGALYSVWRE